MKQWVWNEGAWNRHFRLGVRIMVALYFLAVGLGFVPGTGLQGLTGLLLPAPAANLLAGTIVLAIAVLILAGRWVTVSALSLSALLFLSSYMAMIQIGVVEQLGQFWRDIALIGALMLAHALPSPKSRSGPVQIFSAPRPGFGVVGEMVPADLRLSARHAPSTWRSTRHGPSLQPLDETDEITNIFAVSA